MPENAPATMKIDLHVGLGQAYSGLERWQDAAREFRQTLALSPGSTEARIGLGRALGKAAPPGSVPQR